MLSLAKLREQLPPSAPLLSPAVKISIVVQRDSVIGPITNLAVKLATSTPATAHIEVGPAVATPNKATPAVEKKLPLIQKKTPTIVLEEDV